MRQCAPAECASALSRSVQGGDWSQIASGAKQLRLATEQAYQQFAQSNADRQA